LRQDEKTWFGGSGKQNARGQGGLIVGRSLGGRKYAGTIGKHMSDEKKKKNRKKTRTKLLAWWGKLAREEGSTVMGEGNRCIEE